MKRQTAIKNLNTIIKRLNDVNGIFPTPHHDSDFVRVKRAWVFGSVAKGAENPNDLDIFLETVGCNSQTRNRKGKLVIYRRNKRGEIIGLTGAWKPDKTVTYVPSRKSARHSLIIWLRSKMKKVSVHFVDSDEVFNELDKKILIYPRNDFGVV